jgi:hypothetical protein
MQPTTSATALLRSHQGNHHETDNPAAAYVDEVDMQVADKHVSAKQNSCSSASHQVSDTFASGLTVEGHCLQLADADAHDDHGEAAWQGGFIRPANPFAGHVQHNQCQLGNGTNSKGNCTQIVSVESPPGNIHTSKLPSGASQVSAPLSALNRCGNLVGVQHAAAALAALRPSSPVVCMQDIPALMHSLSVAAGRPATAASANDAPAPITTVAAALCKVAEAAPALLLQSLSRAEDGRHDHQHQNHHHNHQQQQQIAMLQEPPLQILLQALGSTVESAAGAAIDVLQLLVAAEPLITLTALARPAAVQQLVQCLQQHQTNLLVVAAQVSIPGYLQHGRQ